MQIVHQKKYASGKFEYSYNLAETINSTTMNLKHLWRKQQNLLKIMMNLQAMTWHIAVSKNYKILLKKLTHGRKTLL